MVSELHTFASSFTLLLASVTRSRCSPPTTAPFENLYPGWLRPRRPDRSTRASTRSITRRSALRRHRSYFLLARERWRRRRRGQLRRKHPLNIGTGGLFDVWSQNYILFAAVSLYFRSLAAEQIRVHVFSAGPFVRRATRPCTRARTDPFRVASDECLSERPFPIADFGSLRPRMPFVARITGP